jgi:nicotinamide riboside kinase
MIKISIAGLPSSGKSILARKLSSCFLGKNVELIQEYARDYINEHGPITNVWEQSLILKGQLKREELLPEQVEIMISDSPIFLGLAYTLSLRTGDDKEEVVVNDIIQSMLKANSPRRYDIVFYLPDLLPQAEDGTRIKEHFTPEWREKLESNIMSVFNLFPPKKFVKIESSNFNDRVSECLSHIVDTMENAE